MFFMGVNTLFNALMHTPGFNDIDFSRLVATVAGGMALQSSVAARWKEMTGCVVTQGWGLTEASPVGCVNPLIGPYAKFTGSIGLPVPSTEVTIRDDEGRELRQAASVRSACADRRSCAAIGIARGDREGHAARRAGCAPATSAAWMSSASSTSRTARRT
jgi:acyl-CoA synthetase (AMP-forming)/AMP-acid ligase II